MLDTGLLLSGAVVLAAMWLAARRLRAPWPASDVLDRLLLPTIVGLLVARTVALVLDDPTSLRSVRSFLVIRGGVELWPGLAAAVTTLAVSLRRAGEPVLDGLARTAPIALIGYAAFEATCLLREGCYGPHSTIGLRPDGIGTAMVPLGVLVGIVLVAVALLVDRRTTDPPMLSISMALLAVAATRSVAAVWLPRLGEELTRPHRESIAVAVLAGATLLAVRFAHGSTLR